jgi:type I restriction enzyme, S subunit
MADGLNGRGMLPPGWALATVGDLAEYVNRGKAPSYTDNSGIPIINQRCVRWGGVDFQHLKFTTVESFNKTDARQRLRDGDVLWNSTGTGTIGRAAVFQSASEYPNITVDTHVTIIRPSNYHPTLLRHWIFSDFVQKKLDRLQAGSTNQVELSRAAVLGAEIAMPPLAEQHRIVAKIEELFGEIEAGEQELGKAREGLEVYRRAVLKAAVTGELTREWREKNAPNETGADLLNRILVERRHRWREGQHEKFIRTRKVPPKDWDSKYKETLDLDSSGMPSLPSGWCWATWGQVGNSQNGRPFPSSAYQDAGVKLLRPGNLFANGQVRWTERNTRCLPDLFEQKNPDLVVRGGELVINLTAQSLKDEFLGRVCLTEPEERCLLNQRLARLSPFLVLPRFMLLIFKSAIFRRFVDGLNSGSLIQHMFTSQLERFAFPLPPLAEQAAIVERVEDQLSTIEQSHVDIASDRTATAILRQSILAAAFSGKLVPQDPGDEPASVLLERLRAAKASAAPSLRGARSRLATPRAPRRRGASEDPAASAGHE